MNDRGLKVLEQYDLEVTAMRRGRGSYILDTTDGIRILSDCTYSEHKAQFQNRVMEQICVGGYEKVDRIMANKAKAISLYYKKFNLPIGSKLFIYNSAHTHILELIHTKLTPEKGSLQPNSLPETI